VSVLDPVVFSQNKNPLSSYSCKLSASAFLGERVDRKLRVTKRGQKVCFFDGKQKKKIATVKIQPTF
jgi:hypothetical protein